MAREFGREFQRSLFVVVKTEKVTQDYCEALDDDHQSNLIKNSRLRNFIYSSNRALLNWLSNFCRIDLLADDRSELTWKRKQWPYCVLFALLLNTTMLIEYLQRQAKYDYTLFKHGRLEAQLNRTQTSNPVWPTLGEEFKHIDRELRLLKPGPHSDLPFVVEFAILYYLPPALILHVLITYLFNRDRTVLFPLRATLDESNEAFTWVRLVVEELEHITRDSLAFTSSKCDQISDNLTLSNRMHRSIDRLSVDKLVDVTKSRVLMSSGRRLAARHELLVARLKQVALQGRLNRFQRSPGCRDRLELVFFISLWVVFIFHIACVTLARWYLGTVYKGQSRTLAVRNLGELSDLLCMISLFILEFPAACLYVAIFNTTVYDQMLYMKKTRAILRYLIETNSRRLLKMISISESLKNDNRHLDSRLKTLNDHLELDLLVAILQWRLASRTFELMRRPVTWMVLTMVYAMTSVAFLFRSISPYLPAEIRQLDLYIGIFAIIMVSQCVIPLAFLHERWAAVFKSLWSLVALLGRMESVPLIRERLLTSSSVSIFTLRREISDSLQRHERFTCRMITMPITYSNLIRTAAWLVLILSSLFDSQNSLFGEWYGRYMEDPLGLIGRNK